MNDGPPSIDCVIVSSGESWDFPGHAAVQVRVPRRHRASVLYWVQPQRPTRHWHLGHRKIYFDLLGRPSRFFYIHKNVCILFTSSWCAILMSLTLCLLCVLEENHTRFLLTALDRILSVSEEHNIPSTQNPCRQLQWHSDVLLWPRHTNGLCRREGKSLSWKIVLNV